jgi:cytoskeletal protein RodZ
METALAFGRELQQERERRGISLDAVAEATKVASRYLRALESDDFSSLPGGVFNKGFVRSYCRYVGLNEDEWVARMASNGSDPDWTVFAENVKRNRARMGPQMRRRWWGVLLMLCVLGAVAWSMWRYVLRNRLITNPVPPRATLILPPADRTSPIVNIL